MKLYKQLLDDIEWHSLDGECAKALVMLWLIASERDGNLPASEVLAFRLRKDVSEISDIICRLSHWLEGDVYHGDAMMMPERCRSDAPERERERENKPICASQPKRASVKPGQLTAAQEELFSRFWNTYPKKKAKPDAMKAFKKLNPDEATLEMMLEAIAEQCDSDDWMKDDGQFIPYPATWLRGRRWEDLEGLDVSNIGKAKQTAAERPAEPLRKIPPMPGYEDVQ